MPKQSVLTQSLKTFDIVFCYCDYFSQLYLMAFKLSLKKTCRRSGFITYFDDQTGLNLGFWRHGVGGGYTLASLVTLLILPSSLIIKISSFKAVKCEGYTIHSFFCSFAFLSSTLKCGLQAAWLYGRMHF